MAVFAEGYATLFDRPTHWTRSELVAGPVQIVFVRGCFSESLARRDEVEALLDHDVALLLGSNEDGRLDVWEDRLGLRFSLRLPNTRTGELALAAFRADKVTGASLGWLTQDMDCRPEGRGKLCRVRRAELFEISILRAPKRPAVDYTAPHVQLVDRPAQLTVPPLSATSQRRQLLARVRGPGQGG